VPHFVVLQHELVLAARRIMEGIDAGVGADVDAALDVIRDVGPRGHYLAHDHTRAQVRGLPLPARRRGAGFASAEDAARAEFARLARDHRPAPLPADVLAELDRILQAAEHDAERLTG